MTSFDSLTALNALRHAVAEITSFIAQDLMSVVDGSFRFCLEIVMIKTPFSKVSLISVNYLSRFLWTHVMGPSLDRYV